METDLNSRLDAHEQQLNQLHGAMAEIKSSLQVLKADREDQREFQKFFLNWIKQQDSSAVVDSSCADFRSSPPSPQLAVVSSAGSLPDTFQRNLKKLQPNSSVVAAVLSRSAENSTGHGNMISTRVNGAISDDAHWKLGSETAVGHSVEVKPVVDLGSTRLGSPVAGKSLLEGTIRPPVFVPIPVPFDRGKFPFTFGDRCLGCKGGMVPTSHFWVVNGQPRPPETLSRKPPLGCRVFVDTLMKKAYDNWMHVVEYDGKSFLGALQVKPPAPQIDMGMGPQNYSNSFDHQHQLGLPRPATQEEPTSNPSVNIGGYDSNVTPRYTVESQNMNLNAPSQFDTTSFTLHNHLINGSQQPSANDNNILALGLTQPSASNFLSGNTNTLNLSSSFRGLEDYFPEEEIRMRSHEMLENEDMQHLLRLFNMGNGGAHGQTSGSHVNENYYQYSSGYMPNTPSNFGYGFNVDKTRSSGKAVVGWLKLKAALRWGIFIRKQAAERRAQIVELEEDP